MCLINQITNNTYTHSIQQNHKSCYCCSILNKTVKQHIFTVESSTILYYID